MISVKFHTAQVDVHLRIFQTQVHLHLLQGFDTVQVLLLLVRFPQHFVQIVHQGEYQVNIHLSL